MLAREDGVEVQTEGQLDRLARRARWRYDDDAAVRRLSGHEGVVIGRKISVLNSAWNRHGLEDISAPFAGAVSATVNLESRPRSLMIGTNLDACHKKRTLSGPMIQLPASTFCSTF